MWLFWADIWGASGGLSDLDQPPSQLLQLINADKVLKEVVGSCILLPLESW